MSDFGRELARLMQARGIGVRELARAAYCNPGHISNLRSGKARPSPQLAEALDRHLGAGGSLAVIAARGATLTASVDIDAPPPGTEPSALVLFGINQAAPAHIAAGRFHRGLTPLIIATGGINRHNGIMEGREFARQLAPSGVPASAVRVEDQSKDTWQNVELSLSYLREALALGLPLVAVSKWYHLRAVYCLHTQLPEAVPLYAIGWEPVYAGTLVTRDNWSSSPDGRRRVIRESQEVPRRVAEGSYLPAVKKDGAWSLCRNPFRDWHQPDAARPARLLRKISASTSRCASVSGGRPSTTCLACSASSSSLGQAAPGARRLRGRGS